MKYRRPALNEGNIESLLEIFRVVQSIPEISDRVKENALFFIGKFMRPKPPTFIVDDVASVKPSSNPNQEF